MYNLTDNATWVVTWVILTKTAYPLDRRKETNTPYRHIVFLN